MMRQPGMVYVLHLSKKIGGHAGHYCGWSANLEARLLAHRNGNSSALMAEAKRLGITFALTYARPGTKADERKIKRDRGVLRLCSLCRKEELAKKAARQKGYRERKKEGVR